MAITPHLGGSWFGLPDLGLTELAQSVFQPNNTSSPNGGSNLLATAGDFNNASLGSTGNVATNTGSTSYAPTGTRTTSNGTGGAVVAQPQQQPTNNNNYDPYAGLRNNINSGYDQYLSSLDSIINQDLPNQQAGQIGIAQNSYNQGVSNLTSQRDMGLYDLSSEENKIGVRQGKTLRDLSANISNLFRTGNNMLGSRGAGDSSATNQYAYALTKLGSQQRGDVMAQSADQYGQVADRRYKLNTLYNQETNNLKSNFDNQVLSIGQWYSSTVQNLKMQKAQGNLSRSQDLQSLSKGILDQALQQLQRVQDEFSNRKSSLEQWAMNNSSNIGQLQSNMAGISAYTAPGLQTGSINGMPSYTSNGQLYFPGNQTTSSEKRDLFGNVIG